MGFGMSEPEILVYSRIEVLPVVVMKTSSGI
jgi:hypothetical protein